jgi:translation initiation factor IF-1
MGLKNTTGGNKTKKKKRFAQKREYADALDVSDGVQQMFGQILAIKHAGHYSVLGTDNKKYLGRTSKAMKSRQNLPNGLYVVISLREYESTKKTCDIIGYANPPENIKEQFKINNPVKYDDIVFKDSDGEEEDDTNQGFMKINKNERNYNKQQSGGIERPTKINFDDIDELQQFSVKQDEEQQSDYEYNDEENGDEDDDYYDAVERLRNVKRDKFGNDIVDDEKPNDIDDINVELAETAKARLRKPRNNHIHQEMSMLLL